MANSTEEYWSLIGADGQEVSLHQYGWAVTTVGGSRYDLPPRRGENMVMAYVPGQLHRRKLPDQRPITLLMFMVGWEPGTGQAAGISPTIEDQRVQWNNNWDALRRLVYRNHLIGGLVTLKRRWRLTAPVFPTSRTGDIVIAGDPGTPTSGVSRLLTASASAEMTGTMTPAMTGRMRAEFQLDFTLPDPYFYGDEVAYTLNPGQTAYVWNDGHDVAAHANMEISLVGPLTNPVVRNLSVSPTNFVYYKNTIPSGQTVTLKIGRFSAVQHTTGGSSAATSTNNRIFWVSHTGARMWYNLLPGANKVNCSGTGSGHVEVRFRPPYV